MAAGDSFNVRDPEIEAKLRELADGLKSHMPEGWGFTLLLFSYGEHGQTFYISTAHRDDMINVMREFIGRNTH